MSISTHRQNVPAARGAGHGEWRKSSYSGGGNNCVEVAAGTDTVAVRDSKNPQAGQLLFDPATWTAFTAAIKHGGLGRV